MGNKRGSGEGSITRRKDGTWQGAITIGRNMNGTQKRKYFYGKTRAEVNKKLTKAINELNSGAFVDNSVSPTMSTWLYNWLWEYKKNNVKQTTFEQYETIIRIHALPAIGKLKVSALKPEHLQKLYNQMYDNNISARSIQLLNTILHGALKQAVKNNIAYRNVTEAVSLPKNPSKEMRVLTLEEQKKFIDVLKSDAYGNMYLFALFTGLRRGELLALTWSDVSWDEKVIRIGRTLNRVKDYSDSDNKTKLIVSEPKTVKSKRVIPLFDFLIDILHDQQEKQENDKKNSYGLYEDKGIIFATNVGTHIDPSNFNRKFYRLIARADIPHANPHSMRHTFATRGLESNIDLKTMQELLGHSSITVTGNTYTHVLMDKKRCEMDKMGTLANNMMNS